MFLRITSLMLGIFLLAYSNIAAQVENPTPGYLITATGDTITGILNLDNEIILSKELKFFSSLEDKQIKRYTPTELREFGFTESGKIYRKILHKYHDFDRKQDFAEDRMALVLFEGPLTLYKVGLFENEYFKVTSGIPPWVYYIRTAEDQLVKLEITEKQITGVRSQLSYKYRGVLKYIMRDWPQAARQTDNVLYTDEALIRLLEDYMAFAYPNTTFNGKVKVKKTTKVSHFLQASWLPAPNVLSADFVNAAFGASYYVKFFNPAVDNAFEIAVGLEYLTISHREGQVNEPYRIDNARAFRIPVWADYYWAKGRKVQPRIRFGIIGSLLAQNGDYLRTETVLVPGGGTQEVPIGYFPFLGRSPNILFGVGAGVNIGDLRLDIHYEKIMQFSFNVGYRLK